MFHDMEISKVLAEVFESQAKEVQDSPSVIRSCARAGGKGADLRTRRRSLLRPRFGGWSLFGGLDGIVESETCVQFGGLI